MPHSIRPKEFVPRVLLKYPGNVTEILQLYFFVFVFISMLALASSVQTLRFSDIFREART